MRTHAFVIQVFGLLLGASLGFGAANNAAELKVELKGVVDIGGAKAAHLEFTPPIGGTSSVMLREGERMGEIELIKADLLQRKATARLRGEVRDLTFNSEGPSGTLIEPSSPSQSTTNNVALCLDKMGLEQVLKLYAELANRTVLRPAQLPACEISLHTRQHISSADLMNAIARVLMEKDIVIQPDGEKFLVVAREGDADLLAPEVKIASDRLAATLAQSAHAGEGSSRRLQQGSNAGELLPAGLINLQNTDIAQVLYVFADLAGRNFLCPTAMPPKTIKLFTSNPLTRSEAIYSLTATLALNGVSVLPAGEKFVFIFPTTQRSLAAKILARNPAAIAAGTNSIPAGSINLNTATLGMVAQLYREMSGHELDLENGLPNVRILFRSQTPLTPAEALQGFEYALGWNQLVIEKKEDKFILKRAGAAR
jgi:hypothetical protein